MLNKVVEKFPVRNEGWIKRTKGKVNAHEFLFVDTETHVSMINANEVEFPLKLGCVIYVKLNPDLTINKRTVLTFFTIEDFIQILETYCKGTKTIYMVGHNIKFDVMVLNLPTELDKHGYSSKMPIINERMFIWHCRINKSKLVVLDSANFGVISVAQLGKDFGESKIAIDFTAATQEQLIEYCIHDTHLVELFMLSWIRFISENNLGGFRTTLASQSLTAWRTRFMTKSVYIHNDEKAIKLERESYHGGRTECFALGDMPEQDYYYLDINSMYPYVMAEYEYPVRLIKYINEPNPNKLEQFVKAHYCIADVLINTDIPAYSMLIDSKLIFPIGEFRTVLHQSELEFAIASGHIKDVFSISPYEHKPIFRDYVNFFYSLKQQYSSEHNTSLTYIVKLLLNSLYGKFGQTGIHQIIKYGEYQHKIERYFTYVFKTGEYGSEVNWFGTYISERKQGESTYSYPAIAGAVTANARMLLFNIMSRCGLDNVYYCDTDSVITNSIGYLHIPDLLDNSALGKLKLVKKSTHLTIYNPKDYEFGDDIRHKGISPKAQQTERNKWRCLQFPGMLAWLNTGGNTTPVGKYLDKSRKSSYNKGIVDENTGIVSPFIFG